MEGTGLESLKRIEGNLERKVMGKVRSAAKKAQQSAKKKIKRSPTLIPREFGFKVGEGTTKRFVNNSKAEVSEATRTLYSEELTALGGGTGINDRQRQIINCRGFKINYAFRNTLDISMYLNIAVIAPKFNQTGVTSVDFFRSNDGGVRSQNFGNSLSPLEFRNLPINTDDYHVFMHKRHLLGPDTNNAIGHFNANTGPVNYLVRKHWIPVNRQLRYASDLTTSANTPIFFVYWADSMNNPAGAGVSANALITHFENTMYFLPSD